MTSGEMGPWEISSNDRFGVIVFLSSLMKLLHDIVEAATWGSTLEIK